MSKPIFYFLATVFCAVTAHAGVFSSNGPDWTLDFAGGAVGHPTHFGSVEKTRGVLVTEHDGKITLVGPQGEKRLKITLDLPIETPAVAVDLRSEGKLSIVAVDAWGSIYCFSETGERLWKFPRAEKSGEFRLPVIADLDGDHGLEILISDSRGHLDVLDACGRLRMEIFATKYRVGVPAVGDVNGDGKPEIIFGTEAGDVYCLNNQGEMLWFTTIDACLGRGFPLVADADQDGRYEVYLPTAFNNSHPGLYALDAATGKPLWKAPSVLQSYRSTVLADFDGDGRNEILFGDKNSSLSCLDEHGRQRWTTQLAGRGIFFAPAVGDLQGNGVSTSFAVVRNAGSTGKSLYAIDPAGEVVDSLALPGGGGCSPILCRFIGRSDVSLLVLSGSGQLQCHRLEQDPAAAKVLWPGVRNDLLNTGFIRSTTPAAKVPSLIVGKSRSVTRKGRATGGTNKLPLASDWSDSDLVSVETKLPDGSLRLELLRKAQINSSPVPGFTASAPGDYEVTVWHHDLQAGAEPRAQRFLYHLDKEYKRDATDVRAAIGELGAIGRRLPRLAGLAEQLAAQVKLAFENSRRTRSAPGFDDLHGRIDYALRLARFLRDHDVEGDLLIRQISDPWENFDAAEFFAETSGPINTISIEMLDNEFESVAIAVSNLRPDPATLRLDCSAFESGTNQVDAKDVVTLHEVLSVRPDGTGELTEDPLPLLGQGQTIRLEVGETRKVWLTFRSRSLMSDTWCAALKVGDIAAAELPVEVPVMIRVHPVRLPDRFTYRECNWLYLHGIRNDALRAATMRDALDHKMNVFVIPGVSLQVDEQGKLGQSNTAAHDNLVRELGSNIFYLISGPVSIQWPPQFKPEAEQQEKVFADALRWYGEHMRSLGVRYEDFAIYLQDEPGLLGRDAGFEAWVGTVKRFKAAEPRIQLYANPAGGARAELLRPLQDLIDVWAPDLHLVREQPETLAEIFQHGQQYWHYEAPGDQRCLDPLGFYRVKPWVAFQMGMTGGGYWVYSSAKYWFAEPGGGSEYGSVYLADQGPVTTKRWEASRDGIEDFELLWLLRQTAERCTAPKKAEALRLVAEAVRFVTHGQETVTDISRHVRPYTPDYRRWMEYRRQMIQMQMKLAQ